MLSNTQSFNTNDGNLTPVTLERRQTNTPASLGSFVSPTGTYKLDIRQKSTKARKRSEAVITVTKFAVDPITTLNTEYSASVIIAVDQPKVGFTTEELQDMEQGIATWLGFDVNFNAVATGDT